MITNIDIDEAVVADAMLLTGARTKREVVDRALRELVARARRPSVRELFGIGGVDAGYDPKAPGAMGDDVGQYRVEQPRAVYAAAPHVKVPARKTRGGAPAQTSGGRARSARKTKV